MLVIANPYATTVSDRLKNLVVYALQGRYDVDAVDTEGRDHATALCREAAAEGYDVVVAFGGDGTVNEAANGLAGSATAADRASPAARRTSTAACSASRTTIVDATEHLLRARRRLAAAQARPRAASTAATSCSRRGFGLDAARRAPRRRPPRRRRRASATGTSPARPCRRSRASTSSTRRRSTSRSDGETVRGVTALVQNGDPYTYFSGRPLARRRGRRARRRHDRRRGAASARARPTCRRSLRALFSRRRAARRAPPRLRLRTAGHRALRLGRRPPDPAAGRRRLHRRHARGASTRSSPAR